jgi:DNA-binding NtrC family response regulator
VTLCEKSAVVTNKISSAVFTDSSDSHNCAPSQLNTSLSNQESIELDVPHIESFQDADSELIKKYLAEYKGNISKVARKLKVSRGLIYRRITELAINTASFKPSR